MFFCGAAYLKSQSAVFMLPEKGVPSAVSGTVRRWCQDYAAGLEESSTGEVPQLQKFCCHNCWVLAAPRKSKRQLTAESAEYCRTRDGSSGPSREAPARTATGEPCMPLWTWCCVWLTEVSITDFVHYAASTDTSPDLCNLAVWLRRPRVPEKSPEKDDKRKSLGVRFTTFVAVVLSSLS